MDSTTCAVLPIEPSSALSFQLRNLHITEYAWMAMQAYLYVFGLGNLAAISVDIFMLVIKALSGIDNYAYFQR